MQINANLKQKTSALSKKGPGWIISSIVRQEFEGGHIRLSPYKTIQV